MSSADMNKAIVRRLEEELAKGNLDVIDELLAPGFIDRALVPGQGPTREDFKRSSEEFLGLFTYTSYTIEEQIAEGDTVVTKFRASAASGGESSRACLLGELPAGRRKRLKVSGSTAYLRARSPRSGARLMFVRAGRISRSRSTSANESSRSSGWHEASSKPHCPKRCPSQRAGRSLHSTGQPERSEAISTTSTSSLRAV